METPRCLIHVRDPESLSIAGIRAKTGRKESAGSIMAA
jgi:hypothetical protein